MTEDNSQALEGGEDIVDGELVKFEPGKEGMTISGILQSYRPQKDTGKGPGHVYEVKTNKGVAAFFAPSLLHKKLQSVAIGSIVKVTFVSITQTKNGNTLKNFKVTTFPATEANLKALGLDALNGGKEIDADKEKEFNDM